MPRPSKKTETAAGPTNLLVAAQIRDSMQKQYGKTVVNDWDDFQNSIYGVPLMNNLALQYLLGIDVFPMHRWMTITGRWGVTKSGLCWYIAGLFILYSGMVYWNDTEHKANPDQIKAMLRTLVSLDTPDWFTHIKAKTLDECMGYLLSTHIKLQEAMTEYKATLANWGIPSLNIVDSLSNVTSQSAIDKASKEADGASNNMEGMQNAGKISQNMKAVQSMVPVLPVFNLVVNHQKPVTTVQASGGAKQFGGRPSYMPPETKEAGGEHKDFQYTWNIVLAKAQREFSVLNGTTPFYKMTLKKNALGGERPRGIIVPYVGRWVIPEGKEDPYELLWYNWDAALALLLADDKSISRTELAKVMDFKVNGKMFSSSRLGLSNVSATDLGKAIHADAALCRELQDIVLHIRRKPIYGQFRPEFLSTENDGVPFADAAGVTDEPETESDGEEA